MEARGLSPSSVHILLSWPTENLWPSEFLDKFLHLPLIPLHPAKPTPNCLEEEGSVLVIRSAL